jgi:hypothetical protein
MAAFVAAFFSEIAAAMGCNIAVAISDLNNPTCKVLDRNRNQRNHHPQPGGACGFASSLVGCLGLGEHQIRDFRDRRSDTRRHDGDRVAWPDRKGGVTMTGHFKPDIAALVGLHQAAMQRSGYEAIEQLCGIHDDLWETAPASMREFFDKWRALTKFEAELGDPTQLEPAKVMTQMPGRIAVHQLALVRAMRPAIALFFESKRVKALPRLQLPWACRG